MTKKNIILSIVLIAVVGALIGNYLYNKRVPGLEDVAPDYSLSADELFNAFDADEATALSKYEGKVIAVTGEVVNITSDSSSFSVTLGAENALAGGVNCSFHDKTKGISTGDQVTIKGRCQGFLLDVVLNNSSLVKK
ncbi:MAG: hypothetical protein KDC76_02415 [Bacteroidetes bacterium]|nr:hypothetical protein [Bacteroidota bacterium]